MRRKWVVLVVCVFMALLLAGGGAGLWWMNNRGFRAIQRAEAAYAESDWAEAKRQYGWYLARQPDDLAALEKYAEVCQKVTSDRIGALQSAAQALFSISMLRKDDHETDLRTAQFCEDHAIWDSLNYYANYYLKRYRYDTNDPATLNGETTPFLIWMALSEERLGNPEGARSKLESLVSNAPDCPARVFGALARILRQQGYTETAVSMLNEGLERYPNDAAMRVERAQYFLDVGERDAAENEIGAALEIAPDDLDALRVAAKIAFAKGEYERAKELALRVMATKPHVEAALVVVSVDTAQNAVADAVAYLQSLDTIFFADNPAIYQILSELQIELGSFDDVEQTLADFRAAYPQFAHIHDYLDARVMLSKAKPEDANYYEQIDAGLHQLQVVSQRVPSFGPARLGLVRAYLMAASNTALAGEERKDLSDTAKGILISYREANPGDPQGLGLWNQFFVEPTVEEARSSVQAALEDPNAKPGDLARLSERLLAASARNSGVGKPDIETIATAREGLERAFAADPGSALTFRSLVGLYLEMDDADISTRTADTIAKAESSGVDPHAIRVARASLKLKQSESAATIADAISELQTDIERQDLSREDLSDWAIAFDRHGQSAEYAQFLNATLASETGATRRRMMQLSALQAMRMSGNFEGALGRAVELRSELQSDVPGLKSLAEETRAIIAGWLESGSVGDVTSAQQALDWVLEVDPKNVQAKLLKARLLLRQGDFASAEPMIRALRESEPDKAAVFLLSADLASAQGQLDRQLEFATRAASLSPGDAAAQFALARAHMALGDYDETIVVLDSNRRSGVQDGRMLSMLARSLAAAGRYNDAAQVINELDANTIDAPAQEQALASLKAWLAYCRKDWPETESLATRYWKDPTPDVSMLRLLVAALVGQERSADAEQVLRNAASEFALPEVYTEIGRWYLGKGDDKSLNEASSWFTKAQLLSPGYLPAITGMIDINARQNSLGTAVGLCDRYLESVPDDTDMLYRKAFLLAQSSRFDGAIDTCTKAIAISERAELYTLRGTAMLAANRPEEAIRDVQRGLDMGGEATAAIDAVLADAFLKLNEPDFGKAREHYNAAISKRDAGQPVDTVVLQRIAIALDKENT